jgi:hypothetical protein
VLAQLLSLFSHALREKWSEPSVKPLCLVILFGGMDVILLILMQLYRRWSKRTLITVGIVGWLLTFLVSFLRDWAFYQ